MKDNNIIDKSELLLVEVVEYDEDWALLILSLGLRRTTFLFVFKLFVQLVSSVQRFSKAR